MALTKVTLTVDQFGLNAVIAALDAHRQMLVALGTDLTAQAREQIAQDQKRELEKQPRKRARKQADTKPNGHAQPAAPT